MTGYHRLRDATSIVASLDANGLAAVAVFEIQLQTTP